MNNNEKNQISLTAEEAEFIKDLILRNQKTIKALIKSVLSDNFSLFGEDCISEIYLLACEKASVLKHHACPDKWILVASRKVALNMARNHYKHVSKTVDADTAHLFVHNDVFEDALYNIWLDNGLLNQIFDLLTPHEKEIYDMLYKQQLSTKEVAAKMNISPSTVRNINSIIRKKIKRSIETKLF